MTPTARNILAGALALAAGACGLGETAGTAATGAAAGATAADEAAALIEDVERRLDAASQLHQRRLEEAESRPPQ